MVTAIQPVTADAGTVLPQASASASAEQILKKVATGAALPGVDPMDFVRANRIHIKDGSLFIDPYLAIHPRELAPENEAALRKKLALTYSVNNPSFYESYDRLAVALNLAQLVPMSLATKRNKLMEEVNKFNAQVDSGADADLTKLEHDKRQPFTAIVRDTIEKPARDPEGIETLKNGVAMYLLVREKLTSKGYLNPLTSYVSRANTPDQVLGELNDKLGISPLAMRTAALNGGLDGVGKLLGLDAAYVAEVKAFTEHAAKHEFSHNMIEHWHLGRQLLRGQPSTLEQKLSLGMDTRIHTKIEQFRAEVRHFYDVPAAIKQEEKRVAEALNLVEPIQRALMFKLGYEIGFTPDVLADGIAKYPNIYGLHRKAANDLRDVIGTYRIYFSGHGDLKSSMRTLVHEIAHNIWPEEFTPQEVKKIDSYAAMDSERFARLKRVMDEKFPEFEKFLTAYQAGNDAEKAAIAQTTREYFKPYGVNIDEGVLPYLKDATQLRYLVAYAVDTLSVEGARYAKSGYHSANERFREVISRFAEVKQVELRGQPQLMQFLAPGLNQVWENHYIPHLKRVYQKVVAAEKGATDAIAKAQATSRQEMPIEADAMAKVAERAAFEVAPKVEQRPGTPIKPAAAEACMIEAAPSTRVAADSMKLDGMMNDRTLAAMHTLGAMGVQPRM